MNKHRYRIPKQLDDPYKIVFLTLDEVTALCVPFLLILFLFNAPVVGLTVGSVLVAGLKKLKGNEGHGFIHRLAYWYLPPLIKYRSTPPSYTREILG